MTAQNKNNETLIPISSIVTSPHWFQRTTMQDLSRLAKSMSGPNGQLQAITVDSENRLVFGARRLAAAMSLGWKTIRARVVDLTDPLAAIHDENGCRADFLPSEKVRLAGLIEENERTKAQERQKKGVKGGPSENFSQGRSKDKAADAVGWSRPTLEKAKAIVDAAQNNPVLKGIVAEMDATGNISAAFRQLEESTWHFKPGRNYLAALEVDGVSWRLIVSFETEANGIAYFHTTFLNLEGDAGTISTRPMAGSVVYRALSMDFPESELQKIQWQENAENWVERQT